MIYFIFLFSFNDFLLNYSFYTFLRNELKWFPFWLLGWEIKILKALKCGLLFHRAQSPQHLRIKLKLLHNSFTYFYVRREIETENEWIFFCEKSKCYPKWIVNGAENLNGDFSAHVVIFTDAKRNVNDSTSMKSAASILTVFDPIFLSSQSDSIKLLLCAIFFLFVLMKSNSRKSWKFVLGFTSRKKI